MRIPEELVDLARDRRLIPFLGAGFSDQYSLPSWRQMLSDLCDAIEGSLSFVELEAATRGDYLQIAEYLFLKCDSKIGPIRHQLELALSGAGRDWTSSAHTDLVNLGAPQVYTTNYDDLIERTYRRLGVPQHLVVLPKDVALAASDKTQVVKYHGDLQHESTLVLTESAYYRRLDFESPMDLKFRSDLLGKAVLFIGYSFRDVNIRVIWFKLMEMMRDIPEADRLPSYIVRLESSPALEALDAGVGLKTITLSPDKPCETREQRNALVSEFLLSLSLRATSGATIPGTKIQTHVSRALINRAMTQINDLPESLRSSTAWRYAGLQPVHPTVYQRLVHGNVLPEIEKDYGDALTRLLPFLVGEGMTDLKVTLGKIPASQRLTDFFIDTLGSPGAGGDPQPRERISRLESDVWVKVWSTPVTAKKLDQVLEWFAGEIRMNLDDSVDQDIAYLADLALRIKNGILVPVEDDQGGRLKAGADVLLEVTAVIYPAVRELSVSSSAGPSVGEMLAEIATMANNFTPIEIENREVLHQFRRGPVTRSGRPRRPVARRLDGGGVSTGRSPGPTRA